MGPRALAAFTGARNDQVPFELGEPTKIHWAHERRRRDIRAARRNRGRADVVSGDAMNRREGPS
jgi:hypothetical protein